MMGCNQSARRLGLALVFLACTAAPVAAQWLSPQLLNLSSQTACKTARIAASGAGGFHAVYFNTLPWQVQYRRYQNGYLTQPVVLDNNFVADPDICEAMNGDVHVVWEDWEEGYNYAGWARSSNGGQSFAVSKLTTWDGAKYPLISAFGPSNSGQAVFSVGRSTEGEPKDLFWNRYDGSAWGSTQTTGSSFDNEYEMEGICRSLQDGTVFRSYGVKIGGAFSVCYRRYNGSYWEPQVVVAQPGFFSRQSIAVNPAGQVMVVYEGDEVMLCKLYTPGVGWSAEMAQESKSTHGAVTAVPGTNDFYLVYTLDMKQIYGRRYSGGGWLPRELISVGMPDAFTVGADVSAGPDGTIYACWEYWGSGDCQQWFNVRPGNQGPVGTLSGYVRDQFGAGISGATVGGGGYATVSGAGGAYSLQIAAGTQTVSANKDYYTGQSIAAVLINAGQTTNQNFTITAHSPAQVEPFAANASDGLTRLAWTDPISGNFSATMIRFKTSGYPTGPADGTLLCDRSASPGSQDGYTHGSLVNGRTYYYAAFSHDSDGHYSPAVCRSAVPHRLIISEVKQIANDAIVDLRDKAVTAVYGGDLCIYVEEPDRTGGIRVSTSATDIIVGDRVDLTGTLGARMSNGVAAERVIVASDVTNVGTGAVSPFFIPCGDVGGATKGLATGVEGGVGLNNMGMLVTIAGTVTYKVTQYIYVDDGSNVLDGSGHVGVMVRCPSSTIPANVGDTVRVTGVVEGSVPSGWSANRRSVRIRDWNDLTVVRAPLPDTGSISGIVSDQSGNRVSGATVATTTGGYSTTTGSQGTYTIPDVAVGTYSVTASKTGYTSQTLNSVTVTKDQVTAADFTLPPLPGTITGSVQSSLGGPLGGVTISTSPSGHVTTTAADGTYTLTNVPARTYSVSAVKSGYNPMTNTGVVVPPGGTVSSNFTMTPTTGTITGYVRDQLNTAVGGATVSTSAGGYTTTSGSDGSYTLTAVLAGTYSVTASKTGYQSGTLNGVVVIAGQTTSGANVSVTALGVQKLLNGSFDGGYFNSGWWGGYCPNSWGFVWKGSPSQNWFYQNSYNYGGTRGVVHLVQDKHDNYEVGIGQEIAGLTPGATYTLTAESYKPSGCNYTVYMAVRNGTGYGSEMGTTAGTAFPNTAGSWVSQTVTGTVPAGGGIAVYLWVKRPSGASQYDVYFDNASLLGW